MPPSNKRCTQSEEWTFIWGLEEKNNNAVQLSNLHHPWKFLVLFCLQVHTGNGVNIVFLCFGRQLRFYFSKKARHWNFKHFSSCFTSRYTPAMALTSCSCASADNYDSISAKKRDIGTLNMFLLYIIFTNDLPLLGNCCQWFKKYDFEINAALE